jgi:hypothetical protein
MVFACTVDATRLRPHERWLVTFERAHASVGANVTDASLEGLRERAWRNLERLLKSESNEPGCRWRNPTRRACATPTYEVYMQPDAWEALQREVAQRRAALAPTGLRARLCTHDEVMLRLRRFVRVSATALHRQAPGRFLGGIGKRLGKVTQLTYRRVREWTFGVVLADLAKRSHAAGSAASLLPLRWMRLLVLALEGRLCDRCAEDASVCKCEEEEEEEQAF